MWRLHYSVRLPSLGCDFFKLTGTEGSGAGDYVLADRGYSNAAGIRHVATAGGHVTVRVNSGTLPLETAAGEPFDLLAAVETLKRPGPVGVWTARTVAKGGPPVLGRVCALRKTNEAIAAAHAKIRKTAQRKQSQVQPETLRFARYVVVFTTYPPEEFTAADVLEWYRLRWQVELVFKRFKSLARLGHLPKYDDDSAQAWLYGKLLVAPLVEKVLRHARQGQDRDEEGGGKGSVTHDGIPSSQGPVPGRDTRTSEVNPALASACGPLPSFFSRASNI